MRLREPQFRCGCEKTWIKLAEYRRVYYAAAYVHCPKPSEVNRMLSLRYGVTWKSAARLPSWMHRWACKGRFGETVYDADTGKQRKRQRTENAATLRLYGQAPPAQGLPEAKGGGAI